MALKNWGTKIVSSVVLYIKVVVNYVRRKQRSRLCCEMILGSTLLCLILTTLCIGRNVSFAAPDFFVCENENCVQVKYTKPPVLSNSLANLTTVFEYDSLELCRLLCSRYGNLWPLPTSTTELGRMAMEINKERVRVIPEEPLTPVVKSYLNTFGRLFFNKLWNGCESSKKISTTLDIRLAVRSLDTTLDSVTDESYKVKVSTEGQSITVAIEGATIYGVRHGLETLHQLTARRIVDQSRCTVLMLTEATVKDSPVYTYRGLLLDTSRHFLPVADIERTIDGMGEVKLNVLHWHATDTHSFPLEIVGRPEMTRTGAYSDGEIYTKEDQEHLIAYARLRGVRVLLEIDTPAHAGNGWTWGPSAGIGNLVVCANEQPWRSYCVQPPCGQLNLANPNMYTVLEEVFRDVSATWSSSHDQFHMGGDEVHIGCWNSSSEIRDFMQNQGLDLNFTSFLTVWAQFHNKALKIWDKTVGHSNTKIILWTSDLTVPAYITNYLDPKRYIIEAWTSSTSPIPEGLLKLGFPIIFATVDSWYLDHGFWGNTAYHNWRTVYENTLPSSSKLVLGGEVAMWGELADSQSLDVKVWPRTAAAAERLWSNPQGNSLNTYDVPFRLEASRQRLLRLGIQADSIMPEWCYRSQGGCN